MRLQYREPVWPDIYQHCVDLLSQQEGHEQHKLNVVIHSCINALSKFTIGTRGSEKMDKVESTCYITETLDDKYN